MTGDGGDAFAEGGDGGQGGADGSGSRAWQSTACNAGEECVGVECCCRNTCLESQEGNTECVDTTHMRECVEESTDCFNWVNTACTGDDTCVTNTCEPAGNTKCDGGTYYICNDEGDPAC